LKFATFIGEGEIWDSGGGKDVHGSLLGCDTMFQTEDHNLNEMISSNT
jgi:hypothetical protein